MSTEKNLNKTEQRQKRTIEAVVPYWNTWLDHGAQTLIFRITQVLTRHGCFGEYLYRIGAERHSGCQKCGADLNSAQHTTEICPRFDTKRNNLRDAIGSDLSLKTIIGILLND